MSGGRYVTGSTFAMLISVALGSGCASDSVDECTDPTLVGALEFGMRDEAGQFQPFAEGQVVTVQGLQAMYGFIPSLRAQELDPSAPEPSIAIYLDGRAIGGNRAGETTDMTPEGDAYVLDNVTLLFGIDVCCFNKREATLVGSLVDKNCHACSGTSSVTLQFSEADRCCQREDACPSPIIPTLCGE